MSDPNTPLPPDPAAGGGQPASPPPPPAAPAAPVPPAAPAAGGYGGQPQAPQPHAPQPPAYGTTPTATPPADLTPSEDKQWAAWAHFGGAISILAFFVGWFALLAIVPALVIYLVYGKRGAHTRQESKEALNFQITMVGAIIIWAILSAILFAALFWTLPVGAWFVVSFLFALVGWALVIIDVVFSIIAGVRVNAGGSYRYPFAVRLVK
ncbi:DUF4870 domain-containing protein [Rathayibacter sp. YIM 133350]|uniref:DUF4870 domain-containing protein n=1 Tax=Rathayibacter sp. YIM 133350 TaxID=3131992 RepID=UPI00307D6834